MARRAPVCRAAASRSRTAARPIPSASSRQPLTEGLRGSALRSRSGVVVPSRAARACKPCQTRASEARSALASAEDSQRADDSADRRWRVARAPNATSGSLSWRRKEGRRSCTWSARPSRPATHSLSHRASRPRRARSIARERLRAVSPAGASATVASAPRRRSARGVSSASRGLQAERPGTADRSATSMAGLHRAQRARARTSWPRASGPVRCEALAEVRSAPKEMTGGAARPLTFSTRDASERVESPATSNTRSGSAAVVTSCDEGALPRWCFTLRRTASSPLPALPSPS